MASIQQKYNLFRGLLNGEIMKSSPFDVDVDLTTRCNLRCIGCPFHSPTLEQDGSIPAPRDLSPEVFSTLCRDLHEMGTRNMIVSGSGEPLLHPHFFPMMDVAKGFGYNVLLSTNGTPLNEEKARAIIKSGIDTVRISLWASTEEEFKLNYPGNSPRLFNKIIYGIRILTRMKAEMGGSHPRVILYYVLNKHNYNKILTMVDLAIELGCDGLFFTPMYNMQGLVAQHTVSQNGFRNIYKDLKYAHKRLKKNGLQDNIFWTVGRYKSLRPGSIQPCYVSWFHVRVDANGIVIPCGRCNYNYQHGDLKEQSIREIWNGPAIRRFRRLSILKNGHAVINKKCDCTMCCFYYDLNRIHSIYRWFSWIPKKLRTAANPV